MKGFKVYYNLYYGKPQHPPKNSINKYYAWYFFAWDEEQREFVEIEEVDDNVIQLPWSADGNEIQSTREWGKETLAQPAEKDTQSTIEQIASTQNDDEANPLPLWAWFAIIGGAVVVVGGGVVFVVKRRK